MGIARQVLADRIAELEHALGITAEQPHFLATGLCRGARITLELLLTRPFVTKEAVLIATRKSPADDHTAIKPGLAAIYVCRVRRYLRRGHAVTVRTVWGEGWLIEPADRAKVLKSLHGLPTANAGHSNAG